MKLATTTKMKTIPTQQAKYYTFLWKLFRCRSYVSNNFNNLLLNLHYEQLKAIVIFEPQKKKKKEEEEESTRWICQPETAEPLSTWTFFSLQPGTAQSKRIKISTNWSRPCKPSTCCFNDKIAAIKLKFSNHTLNQEPQLTNQVSHKVNAQCMASKFYYCTKQSLHSLSQHKYYQGP